MNRRCGSVYLLFAAGFFAAFALPAAAFAVFLTAFAVLAGAAFARGAAFDAFSALGSAVLRAFASASGLFWTSVNRV